MTSAGAPDLQPSDTPRMVAFKGETVGVAVPVVWLLKLPLASFFVQAMVGSPDALRLPPAPLPVNALPVAPSMWFSTADAIAGRAKSAALTTVRASSMIFLLIAKG